MGKDILNRRIECLYAVKLNKRVLNDIQTKSISDRLSSLKKHLLEATDSDLDEIRNKVNAWAGENPIATEREIEELMKK